MIISLSCVSRKHDRRSAASGVSFSQYQVRIAGYRLKDGRFVRDQRRLSVTDRLTPAMAAGVTDRLWEVADIVKVLEDWEES